MRKLEQKFETMTNNIEVRMLNNFLKPSIQSIENTLKMDINELKSRFNNIQTNENLKSNNFDDSKLHDSSLIKSSTNRHENGNMDTKISEINRLGERLYEKLLEKVKFFHSLIY